MNKLIERKIEIKCMLGILSIMFKPHFKTITLGKDGVMIMFCFSVVVFAVHHNVEQKQYMF